MERRDEITTASVIEAEPEAIWERVTSVEGINGELMPIMRMTVPRGIETLDIDQMTPGERVGRSWILLFGLVPVDYDDLSLVRIERGRGFLENSTMLSQRAWEHERTIEALGDGTCLVTDRIAWEPRLPLPGGLLRPMFRAIFAHRHRRLRKHFGGRAAVE
jgi:ligand-binding SRPBCC domain-containing protein